MSNIFAMFGEESPVQKATIEKYEKPTECLYKFPQEKQYILTNKLLPTSGSSFHETCDHDVLTTVEKERSKIVHRLLKVEYPPQRSTAGFNLRGKSITASEAGAILDINHYMPPYKVYESKLGRKEYTAGPATYHGTKHEQIATMVYEYRMNVKIEEIGLVIHPKYEFIAASPDGIVSKYKLNDKKHTKYVGRMLEIKCPASRKINDLIPLENLEYYWVQMQLQLECCDLDECDFWQCKISEYRSRDMFLMDTDPNEPHKSFKSKMEKGCLIQLLPKNKIGQIREHPDEYNTIIYNESKWIYPPKINMTPYECDLWISEIISNFDKALKNIEKTKQIQNFANDYCFDKVIYWKLDHTNCHLVKRDRKWFNDKLPFFEETWNKILFFRNNKDKVEMLFKYIDKLPNISKYENSVEKNNKQIMKFIDLLCSKSDNIEMINNLLQDKPINNAID